MFTKPTTNWHRLIRKYYFTTATFIFLGDFNSHNTLWGWENTDARGQKIEKLLKIDNIFP